MGEKSLSDSDDEALATAPITSSRKIHLPALNGLRGIAILSVLVVHFAGVDPTVSGGLESDVPFLDLLAFVLGTPVFFVLSGFLLTGILIRARGKPHYFRNFYARRSLRIFPLYFAVLVVLFLVAPGWGRSLGASSSPRWLWVFLENVELARKNSWTFGFLNHFWSLSVEEQYYLVWPFLVLAVPPKRLLPVCVGLAGFALVLRFAITVGWTHLVGAYVLMPCQLDSLCAGGALAVVVHEGNADRLRRAARIAVGAALAAYFLLGWYRLPWLSRPKIVGKPFLASLLCGGVLLLAIGETGFFRRVFGSGPLTFFGRYSYGLYAFHFPLLPFLVRWFPAARIGGAVGSPVGGVAIFVALSTAVCLVLSIASYELYEKRFLRLKSRFGR
ncbi:MAG: acyltransferase family protein [Thermoanaerobaculia bacterium]